MIDSVATTRERLLEAAGEVFAEHGFHGASVRRICEVAGTNIAAINYHFGDKRSLYEQVLAWVLENGRRKHPVDAIADDAGIAERARVFIDAFLGRLLSANRGWPGRVMARELGAPTGAIGPLAERFMRPTLSVLEAIVADARPDLDAEPRRLHALSVIGQCVFYLNARPVIDALFGEGAYGEEHIPALTDHIVATFLRALEQPAEERRPR